MNTYTHSAAKEHRTVIRRKAHPLLLLVLGLATITGVARSQTVFSDNFSSGPSPLWGNEVGSWIVANGVYFAQSAVSPPFTYTSVPFVLTDFTLDCDVNGIKDGGVWLRSSNNGNGILLVTGGNGGAGTGLYWQIVTSGVFSSEVNPVNGLFTSGVSNAHLRIVVSGSTYSVYVNGSTTPATTLTTSAYASGKVALYDNARTSDTVPVQTFDNVVIAIPEPTAMALLLVGMIVIFCTRRGKEAGA